MGEEHPWTSCKVANSETTGAGYDQIDINACTAHDIRVSNVPTAVDDATADVNMFLILGALRGFNTCTPLISSSSE